METHPDSSLKVAVAQSLCEPGDIEGNLDRMEPLIRSAAMQGARLILFSEAGITGYESSPGILDQAVVAGDRTCQRLHALARENNLVIAAGFIERNGDAIHISHGAFFPDGQLFLQRKARTGTVEPQISNFQFGPDERIVFEIDGVRCAIVICADTGILDWRNSLVAQGVHLLLLPTAGCGPRHLGWQEGDLDDPGVLETYVERASLVVFSKDAILDCRRHRMAMASCNQMADNGRDYFHPGHSTIVDSTGELVGLIPGSFIFEHLRPRVVVGEIHSRLPQKFYPPEAAA
ncbi:MAG: carbon-nitrogen hydrolase family protein [Terrimicrobiaceae bacterium]